MSSPFISEERPFRKSPDRTETPRKHKDVTMAAPEHEQGDSLLSHGDHRPPVVAPLSFLSPDPDEVRDAQELGRSAPSTETTLKNLRRASHSQVLRSERLFHLTLRLGGLFILLLFAGRERALFRGGARQPPPTDPARRPPMSFKRSSRPRVFTTREITRRMRPSSISAAEKSGSITA